MHERQLPGFWWWSDSLQPTVNYTKPRFAPHSKGTTCQWSSVRNAIQCIPWHSSNRALRVARIIWHLARRAVSLTRPVNVVALTSKLKYFWQACMRYAMRTGITSSSPNMRPHFHRQLSLLILPKYVTWWTTVRVYEPGSELSRFKEPRTLIP